MESPITFKNSSLQNFRNIYCLFFWRQKGGTPHLECDLPEPLEQLSHCQVIKLRHRLPRKFKSVLGDIKKSPGRGPGLGREWDCTDPRGPCQPQPVCEDVGVTGNPYHLHLYQIFEDARKATDLFKEQSLRRNLRKVSCEASFSFQLGNGLQESVLLMLFLEIPSRAFALHTLTVKTTSVQA